MTKVTLAEYYRRWGENTTIFGGIPSNILVAELTTDEEFEDYLDNMFKAIAPGRRFVVGVADTTPPDAVFDRLVRIGERVEKEGRLPLEAGGADLVSAKRLVQAAARLAGNGAAAHVAVAAEGGDALDEDMFQAVNRDVLNGDEIKITEHVRMMIEQGYDAQEIMDRGLLAAMDLIGARFTDGTVFIPEVLLSARAMNAAVAVLGPYLARENKISPAKVMIGTVKGDLHDIGKNMVFTMMKGSGLDAIDLGIDVPVDTFVAQVNLHRPAILGLSALLTTTMPQMKRVLDALTEAGLRNEVKVIIGGAPVNERYAKNIGADGYARDAGEAVVLAKKLLKLPGSQIR
jgi:methanogenic corrinoid protein MtbC1